MNIQEVIVVEGQNDTFRLRQALYPDSVDTIETGGTGLTRATLDWIRTVQKARGVIILTDPDAPGKAIRLRINRAVPGCKNASLPPRKTRSQNRIGIEYAEPQILRSLLEPLITFCQQTEPSLDWTAFVQMGCSGQPGSRQRRQRLMERFHLGEGNDAKTCWKRLTMLRVSQEQLAVILTEMECYERKTDCNQE